VIPDAAGAVQRTVAPSAVICAETLVWDTFGVELFVAFGLVAVDLVAVDFAEADALGVAAVELFAALFFVVAFLWFVSFADCVGFGLEDAEALTDGEADGVG